MNISELSIRRPVLATVLTIIILLFGFIGYSYLGYYYLLKSDYPTSKEFWNKILAIDPTNATAKKALEGIK